MNKYLAGFINLILVTTLFLSGALYAEDADQETGVRHHGVVFNISKDRRIEKVGGIYEPEGLDKYVDRRMGEINARIDSLEAQVKETNSKIDQILKQLSDSARSSSKTS